MTPRPDFARAWATALSVSEGDERRAAQLLSAAAEMVAQQTSERIRRQLEVRYLEVGRG
jgi:hypothetical protein